MAEVPNIFHLRLPAGKISGEAVAFLGQPVRTHTALAHGIAASQINLLDTADISEAAHVADELGDRLTSLTGSPGGSPARIPPVHPIINGIAIISQATRKLASGK